MWRATSCRRWPEDMDSIADPEATAEILQEENSGLLTELDLLVAGQQMLSEGYMLDENGDFSLQTEEHWSELGEFLFDTGLLTDRDGKPLDEQPDWSEFFTNEYSNTCRLRSAYCSIQH